MRSLLFALTFAGAAYAMPATARDYPYCIKACDFGAARGDCSFSSYQQCQATAAGRDAWCAENPDFNAKAEMSDNRVRQSRRRF